MGSWEKMTKAFENQKEVEGIITNKVKGGFKKLKDSTMEVLKKAWKWVSDAISAAFDFIVAQGKKAIRLLMKFFGVDVKEVGLTSDI